MYVCICNSVTESDVKRAVADGVGNMRELIAQTQCSTTCGRCKRTAVETLESALRAQRAHLTVVRSAPEAGRAA